MIRINLLGVERARAKRPAVVSIPRTTIVCALILLGAGDLIAWRYRVVSQESAVLDQQIDEARAQVSRLRTILDQVKQFETRRGQLEQRVTLIEQLRSAQKGPVHMLDEISRSLPERMWLTEIKQTGEDVVIDGRCTQLTGLSDFVGNLEASGYFKRAIEIVSTTTEVSQAGGAELIRFSIKAQYQSPGAPNAAAPKPAIAPAAKPGP